MRVKKTAMKFGFWLSGSMGLLVVHLTHVMNVMLGGLWGVLF